MKPRTPVRLLAAALIAVALPVPAFAKEAEADDATRRARARDEWYNESYGKPLRRTTLGGPWSPAFRRFMLEAAERERSKWGALIPGFEGRPSTRGGGPSWTNLGPTRADFIQNGSFILNVTDTGRVRSIVPHPSDPNILYVSFSGGGVWRTHDAGANWTPLTEALGSLSTGSLAMDPTNPSILYLGLGDPFDGTGIGLVKSTDGGANWSAPVFLGNSTYITQVMVSPVNTSVVLATTSAGLFRSTNSGASFVNVPLATGGTGNPVGWSIAWAGSGNFVVSVEAAGAAIVGQIWHSSDNGASWLRATGVSKPSGLNRITVAAAPSLRSTLYAMAADPGGQLADFFYSFDHGQTWRTFLATDPSVVYQNAGGGINSPAGLFNTQGWYDQMLVVSPTDENLAFYGGALHTGRFVWGAGPLNASRAKWHVYRVVSEWLGRFGLPYVHADAHAAAYDSAGNLYFGTDGGIFKSTDGGTTFSDLMNVGIVTHLIYNLGSSLANPPAVIGGFQDNGSRVRSGTTSTSTFNQTIGGDGFGCDIKPGNNGLHMLGSLYNTRIQKSTNGGGNFTQACSGIPECGTNNAPFLTKVVPWEGSPTGDVVFTASNTVVYKTLTYADSWTPLGTSGLPAGIAIRNLGVARTNPDVVGIAASGGRVFLTTNGGLSWTQATDPPNNGLSLSYLWFDTTNSDVIYLASVAPDATRNHLWKSVNFGATWAAIDGGAFPFGVPVDVIKNDPLAPAVLYAGTHLGVYRSPDGGTTWARYGAGMPLVEVTDLYLSPDVTLVRASTFGRGFWELVP
jgi:photosystem II stability/assembly factor-like uncharacterized protein